LLRSERVMQSSPEGEGISAYKDRKGKETRVKLAHLHARRVVRKFSEKNYFAGALLRAAPFIALPPIARSSIGADFPRTSPCCGS
jgi:hypothetical protein